MSDYKVTDSELTGIANAIRTKGGTSSPLVFPNGFTSAIGAIPTGGGTIQQLSVDSNGTYTPPSGVDGYAPVVVNVPGGRSKNILGGTVQPAGAIGSDGDIYIKYEEEVSGKPIDTAYLKVNGSWILLEDGDWDDVNTGDFAKLYTPVEYLAVGSTAGAYIDTYTSNRSNAYFEVECNYTATPASNSGIFGAMTSGIEFVVNAYGDGYVIAGTQKYVMQEPLVKHKYRAGSDYIYVDDVSTGIATNFASATGYENLLFAFQYAGTTKYYATNAKVYSCKIWYGDELVRDFVPVYRNSDNEPGMFDLVDQKFYPNAGTGEFTVGPDVN